MATIPEALAIAIQHHQAGRFQAAEQIYRQILKVQPNHAEAWHLLGFIAYQVGNPAVAVEYIEHAITLNESRADFHHNLGDAYRGLGKMANAVSCYRRALQLKPNLMESHNNLGLALQALARLDEAAACFQRAIELRPGDAVVHNNLGNVYLDHRRPAQAADCFRRALAIQPDYAEAHTNLGNALKNQGQIEQAIASYQRALQLKPVLAEAHNSLGIALQEQRKSDEAALCCRRAVELKPDFVEAWNNLGNILRNLGQFDEAVDCYQRALKLKPDYAGAYSNLGVALAYQGKYDEALACYAQTLARDPDDPDAHFNRSLVRLLAADFDRGWPEYHWRWRTKGFRLPTFPQPWWDGRPLEGKTILLHAEQGFGDTIQFIRYAPLVKQAGGRVLVECQKPLVRLLTGFCGVDQLLGRGDALPPFDFHIPLLSLPGVFRTRLETVPAKVPYLFADPQSVQQWRAELGPKAGRKIGIAWRGSATHANDRSRSLPLSCFQSLVNLPDVRLFSLQKGPGVEELQELAGRLPIEELGSRLHDFMDTAAVLANLDLVITCDTALAHLAGALGIPVWVALPLVPDWRWMLDRDDSPWYPTLRLFRQKKLGDWPGVFDQITTALSEVP